MRVPVVIAAWGSAAVGWARGSNGNRTLISLGFSTSSPDLRSLELIGRPGSERLANINEVLSEAGPSPYRRPRRGLRAANHKGEFTSQVVHVTLTPPTKVVALV